MASPVERRPCVKRIGSLVAVAGVSLAAGCVAPISRPTAPAPPQLLDAAALAIPAGCEPTPGAMYRTNFNVQPDGHVSEAASESGNGCVERALRDWVATFSYAPLRETTTVAFDWMIVTAARNN